MLTGKVSSILVFEIIKTSMLPLTCSARNFNFFLIELKFKWAKTDLFKLSLLIDFKSLTQSLGFWLSKDVRKLPSSVKMPGIFWVFCKLTIHLFIYFIYLLKFIFCWRFCCFTASNSYFILRIICSSKSTIHKWNSKLRN